MNARLSRILPLALLLTLPQPLRAVIVNVDFNGVRNGDGGLPEIGLTYSGPSAAGGGSVWNGVVADSRLPDGTDDDAITFSAANLVDAENRATTVGFTMGPVAAGRQPEAVGNPTDLSVLVYDWVLVGYFNETTGRADFTISGLGNVPTVDLYFYHRGDFPGVYEIGGAVPTPFSGAGVFTSGNTVSFRNVLVTDGAITGAFTEGSTLLGLSSGFTIVLPEPGPYVKSWAPTGKGVAPDALLAVEIWENVTAVDPASVQMFLNGQPVPSVQTVREPQGKYWTVSARPPGGFMPEGQNTVRVVFGDTATPPVSRTHEYGFEVVDAAKASRIVNVDLNGWRVEPAAVTFVGEGVAGGGTVFNAVTADSSLGDDLLTVSGTALQDSIGKATAIGFTLSPVAGVRLSASPDPAAKDNLFGDFVAVGYQGQTTGTSDFTISGLGNVPTVDLYFYFREDPLSDGQFAGSSYVIEGITPDPFPAHGIYNDGNTVYLKNVPVVGGSVTGKFEGQVGPGGEGSAAGAMSGLTIQMPTPKPYVRKALPKGDYVQPDATVLIELQDYVTVVDEGSVLLAINGETVTPTVNKPAGSTITTVTYTPPKGWLQEVVNTMKVTFSDRSTPPLVQSEEFSFFVISPLKASRIVNVDINGVGHSTIPLGPTYLGSGAAGGGSVFNGITARSRLPDGTDDDAITVSGANLLDSVGGPTTFGFTLSPVGAGNSGSAGPEYSEKWSVLNHDWVIIGYQGAGYNCANEADFTISGLGTAPVANLYFYFREDPREDRRFGSGAYELPGVTSPTPYPDRGLFGYWNTTFFEKVPVTNGSITGRWKKTSVLALMTGLTIELPLPHAFVKSYAPEGGGFVPGVSVVVELSDFDVVQVAPDTIHLWVNNQEVQPTINKPAGSVITTVTYAPAGGWPQGSRNNVRLSFSDTAAPPVVQTKEFSFEVVDLAQAAKVVNIDINGSRNGQGGVPEIGPTFGGQSPAGGGQVWNGIVADSRLPDGQDDDAITFSGTQLVDSIGNTTAVSFTMGPVAGGNQGTGTLPTGQDALFFDWVLVGYFGEVVGTADFVIEGLGSHEIADLYFYHRGDFPGTYVIGGTPLLPDPFAGVGIFTPSRTLYFKDVAIVDGRIAGQFTEGSSLLGLVSGLTVVMSPVAAPPGPLTLTRQGATLTLTWPGTGVLQSANEVTGGWTDVTGAASPYPVTPSAARGFYRLRQ